MRQKLQSTKGLDRPCVLRKWPLVSLLKKPELPGKATSANNPINKNVEVSGKLLNKPPILKISCWWCIFKIMLPAVKNNKALKKAWVIR